MFNTYTSDILSYKSIIYKSPNNTNQYIFLTMSPSTNTQFVSTATKETLAILPPKSPTSPYLPKYDLDNIHNYI